MAALSAVAPVLNKAPAVSTGKAANTNSMMVWQPHGNKCVRFPALIADLRPVLAFLLLASACSPPETRAKAARRSTIVAPLPRSSDLCTLDRSLGTRLATLEARLDPRRRTRRCFSRHPPVVAGKGFYPFSLDRLPRAAKRDHRARIVTHRAFDG